MKFSNSLKNLFNIIERTNKKDQEGKTQSETEKKRVGYFSSQIIKILISFTNILKTCDGRDKLCAFIQYTSKFNSTILYHSIDLENSNVEDPFQKYDALKNVEKSMSSGRKIFRFLKWMEDFKGIYYYVIYKDTTFRNLFKALMHIASFFYHIFDNLVWSSNVGVISEYFVGDIKLKNTKNFFSLIRNLIKISMDIYKFNSLYMKNRIAEEDVFEVFEKKVENFETHINKKLLDEVIKYRAKLRNTVLDISHSFLRICMLFYSLKLEPFYSNLHPIFSGFCGMAHSIISLYKTLNDKSDTLLNKTTHSKVGMSEKGNFYKKKRSLETIIDEIDERPEIKILDDNYFENYYIDFNKDFPIRSEDVINKQNYKSIV